MSYPEHSNHAHYVTARDHRSTAYLAGPFRTRQEAEALVGAARATVADFYRNDMRATFATFGTSRVTTAHGAVLPAGKLNARLNVTPTRVQS